MGYSGYLINISLSRPRTTYAVTWCVIALVVSVISVCELWQYSLTLSLFHHDQASKFNYIYSRLLEYPDDLYGPAKNHMSSVSSGTSGCSSNTSDSGCPGSGSDSGCSAGSGSGKIILAATA